MIRPLLPGTGTSTQQVHDLNGAILAPGLIWTVPAEELRAVGVLADDRISEDYPACGDVEFPDFRIVGAGAGLEDRHRAQQA